jgi:hypothetical protein
MASYAEVIITPLMAPSRLVMPIIFRDNIHYYSTFRPPTGKEERKSGREEWRWEEGFVSRVRRICNFFIRFEANLSEYGSYSLHIRMFWYIRQPFIRIIRFIFASNIPTNSHANIHFLMLANTCFKIFVAICKTLIEFNIQANIR